MFLLTRKSFTLIFHLPNLLMFFRAQGSNQVDLVEHLVRAQVVKTPAVKRVLGIVDRKNYAGESAWGPSEQYLDSPLPIQCGQTISAPHMHGYAMEDIYPYLKRTQASEVKILDVGCGSGYLTAALGRMVDDANGEKKSILGKKGKVYGIDVHPELVKLARENIMKEDSDLLRNNVVELSVGDGWKGLPEKGPFDVIHVGAAADTFPKNLMMQLQLKGALIVPVGPDGGDQALYKVERVTESDIYNAKDFKKQRQLGVRYVPLIHPKN